MSSGALEPMAASVLNPSLPTRMRPRPVAAPTGTVFVAATWSVGRTWLCSTSFSNPISLSFGLHAQRASPARPRRFHQRLRDRETLGGELLSFSPHPNLPHP